jgi:four helix bundle protein
MIGNVENLRKPAFSFEDLDVWKKAFDASIDIHKSSLQFPKIEQYALADQIRRASKSICSNLAEGFGKQKSSKMEFRHFVVIALGSANEMLVWVRYCLALGYIDQGKYDFWAMEYTSICKMLNALHERS